MVIKNISEFPFEGAIYKYGIDESLPPDQQIETDIKVLEFKCDIQEFNNGYNKLFIDASFKVFFPFDRDAPFEIKRGMTFKGAIYGMKVEGKIIGVFPTQMGCCSIYIKVPEV